MVDETTNTEQMVLYDNLQVHEELIGLYSLESISADVIVTAIKDIMLHMNLTINNCRGQCGHQTNWSGIQSVLYTHCYGRALNLAIQDVVKGVKVMEDTLDTIP